MVTMAAAAAAAAISATRSLRKVTTSTTSVAVLAHPAAAAAAAAAADPTVEPEEAAGAAARRGIRGCLPRAVTLASSSRGRGQRPACPSLCGKTRRRGEARHECVERCVGVRTTFGVHNSFRVLSHGGRCSVRVRWAGLHGTSRLAPSHFTRPHPTRPHPTPPHLVPCQALPHTEHQERRTQPSNPLQSRQTIVAPQQRRETKTELPIPCAPKHSVNLILSYTYDGKSVFSCA